MLTTQFWPAAKLAPVQVFALAAKPVPVTAAVLMDNVPVPVLVT